MQSSRGNVIAFVKALESKMSGADRLLHGRARRLEQPSAALVLSKISLTKADVLQTHEFTQWIEQKGMLISITDENR